MNDSSLKYRLDFLKQTIFERIVQEHTKEAFSVVEGQQEEEIVFEPFQLYHYEKRQPKKRPQLDVDWSGLLNQAKTRLVYELNEQLYAEELGRLQMEQFILDNILKAQRHQQEVLQIKIDRPIKSTKTQEIHIQPLKSGRNSMSSGSQGQKPQIESSRRRRTYRPAPKIYSMEVSLCQPPTVSNQSNSLGSSSKREQKPAVCQNAVHKEDQATKENQNKKDPNRLQALELVIASKTAAWKQNKHSRKLSKAYKKSIMESVNAFWEAAAQETVQNQNK